MGCWPFPGHGVARGQGIRRSEPRVAFDGLGASTRIPLEFARPGPRLPSFFAYQGKAGINE